MVKSMLIFSALFANTFLINIVFLSCGFYGAIADPLTLHAALQAAVRILYSLGRML